MWAARLARVSAHRRPTTAVVVAAPDRGTLAAGVAMLFASFFASRRVSLESHELITCNLCSYCTLCASLQSPSPESRGLRLASNPGAGNFPIAYYLQETWPQEPETCKSVLL